MAKKVLCDFFQKIRPEYTKIMYHIKEIGSEAAKRQKKEIDSVIYDVAAWMSRVESEWMKFHESSKAVHQAYKVKYDIRN